MVDQRALPSPFPRTGAVGVREIADSLFRQKRILVPLFAAILLATVGYLLLAPPTWQAEITLMVKSNRTDLVVSPENNASQTPVQTTEADIATEVQLLSSRELLRKVVQDAHLARNGSEAAIDRATDGLALALKISPVLRSNMIRVQYGSHDPQQTALVL
ncbi:MAG TPA: Wzz/FepE/Etk N-terminal domain-containing protein, partial [Bryobacteraceae bacterium]|nr:Wzz/FepE/Etk N-terminal domain-containing protein [Bryobacteraceae bacterium]